MAVKTTLEKLQLHPVNIALGEVSIEENEIDKEQLTALNIALQSAGFELLDDKRSKLIGGAKTFIINAVHHTEEQSQKNYSELLSQHLHHDYSYISNLFSETEGITIEQYIIHQKIEKVKELLTYDELSLSQIAFQLGYSSVAHLSNQFKKVTGLTPSHFRLVGQNKRKPLDKV